MKYRSVKKRRLVLIFATLCVIAINLPYSTGAISKEYGEKNDIKIIDERLNAIFDDSGKYATSKAIIIEGEIRTGAYEQFKQIIENETGLITRVYLNSPGGNAEEAMKIGRLIRALNLETHAPQLIKPKNKDKAICGGEIKNKVICTCESACFLIFVAGSYRIGNVLGTHRIYYDHAFLKMLTANEAKNKTQELKTQTISYLKEMGVTTEVIEKTIATSSHDMSFLDEAIIQKHLNGYISELDEWITAKCGPTPKKGLPARNYDIGEDKVVIKREICRVKNHNEMVSEALNLARGVKTSKNEEADLAPVVIVKQAEETNCLVEKDINGKNVAKGKNCRCISGDDNCQVIIIGGLDKSVIEEYITRQIRQIRTCYEKELSGNPKLAGRIGTHFVISGSGRVTMAGVESSTMGSTNVESCLIGVIKRIVFPEPLGGGIVEVKYPFTFSLPK